MTLSPGPWVPPGAWLAPGYAEWRPPPALRGLVACLWASVPPGGAREARLVLPDACSDLIWAQGAGVYLAGPDTGPAGTEPAGGRVIAGIRFAPGAGGQVLGLPLNELRDQRVPLAAVLKGRLPELPPELPPEEAAARLLDLAGRLVAAADADPAALRAAARLRDPAARAEDIATETGLSERQLRRRVQAAAGYGPKTLQRVLRFQRFVRLADAAPVSPAAPPLDLAGAAARAGYADQPHLTREVRALSGHTPAELARLRRPVPVG